MQSKESDLRSWWFLEGRTGLQAVKFGLHAGRDFGPAYPICALPAGDRDSVQQSIGGSGGRRDREVLRSLRVRRTPKAEPESLDDLMDEWLAEAKGERRHLSILGEFGTGKSWFARRLNYRVAHARKRVPILFQLRNWSERFDLRGLITDTLVNTHKLRLASDYRAFERLNREGRLLLIFDGFDEMVRNANNPRTATENFEAIATLAKPWKAKILLTCRTEYFSTEKDVKRRS